MTATALVTGCAGFVGSNLVDHLLERGHIVYGLDDFSIGLERNIEPALSNPRFTLIEASILDGDLPNRFDSHIDVIYHFAAVASVKQSIEEPLFVHNTNATGTLNVLELARINQIRRVVFSSSAAVYGTPDELPVTEAAPVNPMSPYGASKLAAEMYVKSYHNAFDLETVILRYFNIYGPRQIFSEYSGVASIFITQTLQDMPITIDGDGSQTRSMIHVDDVVELTRLAGQSDIVVGEIINVAGRDTVTILDLAKKILSLVPDSESRILYGPPRQGDVKESIGSGEKAKRVLDFAPAVGLDDGLERTIDWYRNFLLL